MTAEEIDKLSIDFYNAHFNWTTVREKHRNIARALNKYLQIELPNNIEYEDVKRYYSEIMKKIEAGDYQHFWQLISNGRNNHLIDFMLFSSKKDDIKKLIDAKDTLKIYGYDLVELIKATQDSEYIKNCIANREQLKLGRHDMIELIMATQDLQFMKSCIGNRDNLDLDEARAYILMEYVNNPEFIKSCFRDRARLGLNTDKFMAMIKETQKADFIKSFILDRKNLLVDEANTVELILLLGDLEFIKDCEGNLHLSDEGAGKLKKYTKGTQVNLPPKMTIGVEIESEGYGFTAHTIKKFLVKGWQTKSDRSLLNGIEVVSPILQGGSQDTSEQIKRVCATLSGVPNTISERCGGHIHIGGDYLSCKQDWVNLIEMWSNAEKVIYVIANEEGKLPRERITSYANPISKSIEKAINEGTINLDEDEDLPTFARKIIENQNTRYFGINFSNIGNMQKNTIEFRVPNGTLNPNTWIENINLFGGMIKCAHQLTCIQKKPESQRTEAETRMLECFNAIQQEDDENKIAEALIKLCIEPSQRQVYINRYNTNSKLLDSSDMKSEIFSQISTHKIGKKVFTGKDAINGVDYMQGVMQIEMDLRQNNISQGIEQGE